MKLAVIAVDSDTTWLIVNVIRSSYSEVHVGVEKPVARWTLLRNRIRRQGVLTVFGQLLFMLLCQPFLKFQSRHTMTRLLNAVGMNTERPIDLRVSAFSSVNSEACRLWLSQLEPDIVVVNGTRIIHAETLNSCQAIFLNTHCGITPAYRGVHGAYWALVNGDIGNVGVTVHVVDTGVDTGDIVDQAPIEVDTQDNFFTYPLKQYLAAIPLLLQAIADAQSGCLQTRRRDDLNSAIWFHPTIWSYLMNRFKRGVR